VLSDYKCEPIDPLAIESFGYFSEKLRWFRNMFKIGKREMMVAYVLRRRSSKPYLKCAFLYRVSGKDILIIFDHRRRLSRSTSTSSSVAFQAGTYRVGLNASPPCFGFLGWVLFSSTIQFIFRHQVC